MTQFYNLDQYAPDALKDGAESTLSLVKVVFG